MLTHFTTSIFITLRIVYKKNVVIGNFKSIFVFSIRDTHLKFSTLLSATQIDFLHRKRWLITLRSNVFALHFASYSSSTFVPTVVLHNPFRNQMLLIISWTIPNMNALCSFKFYGVQLVFSDVGILCYVYLHIQSDITLSIMPRGSKQLLWLILTNINLACSYKLVNLGLKINSILSDFCQHGHERVNRKRYLRNLTLTQQQKRQCTGLYK